MPATLKALPDSFCLLDFKCHFLSVLVGLGLSSTRLFTLVLDLSRVFSPNTLRDNHVPNANPG